MPAGDRTGPRGAGPMTGRGAGENYQIGFVDICDTPYPEIVAASREVGYGMYEYRSGGK